MLIPTCGQWLVSETGAGGRPELSQRAWPGPPIGSSPDCTPSLSRAMHSPPLPTGAHRLHSMPTPRGGVMMSLRTFWRASLPPKNHPGACDMLMRQVCFQGVRRRLEGPCHHPRVRLALFPSSSGRCCTHLQATVLMLIAHKEAQPSTNIGNLKRHIPFS